MFSNALFTIVPVFFAFAAAVLSLVGNTYCETVVFYPSAAYPSLPTLPFGVWLQKQITYGDINGELHVGERCLGYSSSTDIDSKWKSVRAFAVLAPVFGLIAMGMSKGGSGSSTSKIGGLVLLVASLFQGLTMLILASNACDATKVIGNDASKYEQVCSFGWGIKLNIASCALFFTAGLLMMVGFKKHDASDSKPATDDVAADADADAEEAGVAADEPEVEAEPEGPIQEPAPKDNMGDDVDAEFTA